MMILDKLYLNTVPATHKTEKSFFKQALSDTLKKAPPKIMKHATSVEFFLFLSESVGLFFKHSGLPNDPYLKEKQAHNNLCLGLVKQFKEELALTETHFGLALYFATRANWIDLVEGKKAVDGFLMGFREEFNELLSDPSPIQTQCYFNRFFQLYAVKDQLLGRSNGHILYELDNNGEVVFDLLIAEFLLQKSHRITFVVKSQPVVNDVTRFDLESLLVGGGLDAISEAYKQGQIQIVESGSIIAGKYVFETTTAYQTAYLSADVVILKGQGNFQTLPMGLRTFRKTQQFYYAKPHIHLMGIKSPIIMHCFARWLKPENQPRFQSVFAYFHG